MIQPNYESSSYFTEEELGNLRARYAGEVTMVSKNIGRVLRMVEDMGLYENTIVTLLSDHGIFIGERGRTGKSHITPQIFDAFPQHTEISRLVWMMRMPGVEPERHFNIVQPPDLLPTIVESCGLDIQADVEGRSLLPVMTGEEDPNPPELAISTWTMPTHFSDGLVFCRRPAVTDGEWTLILHEPPEPKPPALYHVSEDPTEQENLVREYLTEAQRLHSMMLSWLEGTGTPGDAIDRLKKVEWPG